MRLASHEVTIDAPADVVWAHLTTAEGLVRWVGPHATVDPVPGGVLRWTHPNGATVVGRFLELVPHRRLVFSHGWADDLMGVPPESDGRDRPQRGGRRHHLAPRPPWPSSGRRC